MNPVNEWIRKGGDLKGKNQRRLVVAGVCAAIGVACAPFTYGGSLLLLLVTAAKIRNVMRDKS